MLGLPAQLHYTSWDGDQRHVHVLLPTSTKLAHYIDDIVLIHEELASAAGHATSVAGLSARENTDGEPTENSRPRNHHKVLRIIWLAK